MLPRALQRAPSLTAAAVLVALLALVPRAPADEPSTCGKPGKPPCPLQRFMREWVAAPLAKRDLPALGSALDRVRSLNPNPDKWGNWDKIAREGAEAARAGEVGRVRDACGRCHRVYRRQYNFQHRERPIAGQRSLRIRLPGFPAGGMFGA